jgi:catechol 2,3-dioxygenase-like lactoylglutathione lyase family enzyme
MLSDVTPIPTLAVKDLDAARDFYEDVLGFTVKEEITEARLVVYGSGQGSLQIYASEFAGTNKATAVTWMVPDAEAVVDELRAKGVSFEHYPDMPGMKLEGDIHYWGDEKAVWFKDPDGNILCAYQRGA